MKKTMTLSSEGYSSKPSKEIPSIKFIKREIEINELETYIRNGYTLSANFKCSYPITQRNRKGDNFESIPYVMIDMDDDVNCDLQTLVESLALTPTVAYTTFSHGDKGNRYRLLYFMDKPIVNIKDYKTVYSFICNECSLELKDSCGNNAVQMCFGSKSDCSYIFNDSLLEINKILLENEKNEEVSGHYNILYREEREKALYVQSPVTVSFSHKDYRDDYFSCTDELDLFQKYDSLYPFFQNNMNIRPKDDSEPIIIIPTDYLMIKRPYIRIPKHIKGSDTDEYRTVIRRWRDGEGRKTKLFMNGILRRFMREDISFEHLLHCLRKERFHYYDNTDNELNNKRLVSIAKSVMKTNLEDYIGYKEDCQKSNPKYIVNRAYCNSHGISPRSVAAQYKCFSKDNERLRIFDPSLTDLENIKLFKENGLGKDEKTVRRFRKRHGIGNFRERNKNEKDDE